MPPLSMALNGMSDKVLDDVRMMTRTATSTRAAGGSSRIDLLLQSPKDIDPSFAANSLPLIAWAKRINNVSISRTLAR